MKTYNHLYDKIISLNNLVLAWQKARMGKTKRKYVIEFEKDLNKNLLELHNELKNRTYRPKPLKTSILRDPKTRVISKSDFRDRVIHHAIYNIIEPIFDKIFIYDSCANRIGKGNLFALKRFDIFKRKITKNLKKEAFCLKADIRHYFQEVDHQTLINILKGKISDINVIYLIELILRNNVRASFQEDEKVGMPLGNLTSQFFANVYLNELDYFVKHSLKANYYIRYVDDFVILHESKRQLKEWQSEINNFLSQKLRLELHPDKSKIISLSKGVDFVGFRNFYHFRLIRKRNIKKMQNLVKHYEEGGINYLKLMNRFEGWNAYSKWANTYKLRKSVLKEIAKIRYSKEKIIRDNRGKISNFSTSSSPANS